MKRILIPLMAIFFFIAPTTLLAESATFTFDNKVALSMVRGEIPAPIETTRFQNDSISGSLTVDFNDLTKTRGTVKIDLTAIQSMTFGDAGKNKTQTEHMMNWFEIGPDIAADVRNKNRWVTFKINKISSAVPQSIKQAKPLTDEIGTAHAFKITAKGDLTVHGITKPKTVELSIVIYNVNPAGNRYKEAKRIVVLRTRSPLGVSLNEHDVKPRDTGGKFLAKALSVVGLKIADTAEISLDLRGFQAK